MRTRSALDAPRGVAADEGFDLRDRDEVEVAADRVLQAGGRDRELQRVLRAATREEAVDEAGGEAVAGADAVDDVQ